MKHRNATPTTLLAIGLFLALIVVKTISLHAASFVFPETRAGDLARGYIESLNSGDAEQVREYTENHRSASALAKRSVEDRVRRSLQMHGQMGELVPVVVTDSSEGTVTLTVHAKNLNMYLSCKFEVEQEEPYRLDGVMIQPTSPPNLELASDGDWRTVSDLLEQLCESSGIPAISTAVVEDGRIVESAAIGDRWIGGQAVEATDAFHIGSVTKSITATMIAIVIERGDLRWDSTIGDVISDLPMRAEYRVVTLEQLLQHRGGLPAYATMSEEEEERWSRSTDAPTEQRRILIEEALGAEPVGPAGEMIYSNAGYVVAGYMAEMATGESWESLVYELVMLPLGMEHSGFGWPATDDRPNQPRGHFSEDDTLRPQGLDEYPLGAYLSPAGNIHMSITDLAIYARLHLDGLAGQDGLLRAETVRRLHETAGDDAMGYACGWVVKRDENGNIHYHAGSAGTFYASVELFPAENRAIVTAMNVGPDGAAVVEEITKQINERRSQETP